jgi:radical SAM protein with 4Fe4S-binding SPASM domain
MPREVVFNIIEKALQNSDAAVEFDFHGGEPFLKFDVMREVAEYFWKKHNPENRYVFFATTNGTLLTDDIKQWLSEHKDHFWCGLSYDGTRAMQDTNRSHSSDAIDLDFFLKTWPKQPIKMTVSRATLPDLAKGTIFLHKKGFRVNNNLAYGVDWNDDECIKTLAEQLETLTAFYLENPAVAPSSILSINVEWFTRDDTLESHRICGAGKHMKCFDTAGTEYPCHFFMEINNPAANSEVSNPLPPMNWSDDKQKKSGMEILRSEDCLLDSFCKACKIRLVCPTCYGYNFMATGDPSKRDRNLCVLSKIQALACAIFALRRIKQDGKLVIKDEEIPIGNALRGIDCVLHNDFFLNDERLQNFTLL